MKKRIKKVFKNYENPPDIIILKNSTEPFIDPNFFYTTGLSKGLFENCTVLLYPDGSSILFVIELEEESAKKSESDVITFKSNKQFIQMIQKLIKPGQKIGLNFPSITHRSFENFKNNLKEVDFFDISKSLSKTRLIKDSNEIQEIKKACNIVDRVVEKIPSFIHEGTKEYELGAEINYHMQKFGAEKPAFETISSFGKNSSQPHYTQGNVKLNKGDFVLCDFGACVNKYNSDITRTFIFGPAAKTQKKIYETVKQAQLIGIDEIKSGAIAKDVHEKVNSYIDKSEFKGKFIHSTGHSLGLSVHDPGGGLNQNCELELKQNMVFTVEPGIYHPELGGVRIEDDILVKSNSAELLTKADKKLIEI